jgi:hypothetical protein
MERTGGLESAGIALLPLSSEKRASGWERRARPAVLPAGAIRHDTSEGVILVSTRRKLVLSAALCAVTIPMGAPASSSAARDRGREARHVLLLSVDGLHASDLADYVRLAPGSTLARLSRHGTTYANALTTLPSDSFPGMLALATGGTPRSTGVYYDDSYDRSLFAPGSGCAGQPGAEIVYDETVDHDLTRLDGGGGIDPAKLPLSGTPGDCHPLFPHSFLRVNTIFEVAREAGLPTAWSDKHPSYDLLNGPSGAGVGDLFTPEIAANDPVTGSPFANSEDSTIRYDGLKVDATVDEIHGLRSDGSAGPGEPAIFGMNFQAVSVAQKLPDPAAALDPTGCPGSPPTPCPFVGGYRPDGSFGPALRQGLDFVDASLARMVAAMTRRERATTEIVITAKHGQSPVDPAKLHRVGKGVVPDLVTQATGATVDGSQAQVTEDDVALIWLARPFQGKDADLLARLRGAPATSAAFIDHVIGDAELGQRFGDPATDPRVPDAIVQPKLGGLYSTSKAKVAEHGGGTLDDRNVALLVVDPSHDDRGDDDPATVDDPVSTTQVAPSILRFLRLDPSDLRAVREEGTRPLPHD